MFLCHLVCVFIVYLVVTCFLQNINVCDFGAEDVMQCMAYYFVKSKYYLFKIKKFLILKHIIHFINLHRKKMK